MAADYRVGDVRDRLAEIPDGSIDLVLTSPPFLALRSYLPAEHPDKHREIGSEATPAEFLATLIGLSEEWARVLAPHGSIAVELGDTYSGSGGAGGDYNADNWRDGQERFNGAAAAARAHAQKRRRNDPDPGPRGVLQGHESRPDGHHFGGNGWPLSKSLCLVPQLYATSLAYGRNLLTGEPTEPWRVRNWITWGRPNPPVGALGDKVRPASSFFTVACKSGRRWFDLDAVRGPGSSNTHARTARGVESRPSTGKHADDERRGGNFSTLDTLHLGDGGAPPLDWWTDDYDEGDELAAALLIESTQPYKGAHYATWPEAIARRMIAMMCPPKVCVECGEPSRRITEPSHVDATTGERVEIPDRDIYATTVARDVRGTSARNGSHARASSSPLTLGWSDCGHNAWRRGVTLDPFAGSGTTLVAAHRLDRDAIGIDLDPRNLALYEQRLADVEGGLYDALAELAETQLALDTEGL